MAAQTEMSCSDPVAVPAPTQPPVLQCTLGRQDEHLFYPPSRFHREYDSVYREEQKTSVSRAGSERSPHPCPSGSSLLWWPTPPPTQAPTLRPGPEGIADSSCQPKKTEILFSVTFPKASPKKEHSHKSTPLEHLFADWAATAAVSLTFLCLLSPSLTK